MDLSCFLSYRKLSNYNPAVFYVSFGDAIGTLRCAICATGTRYVRFADAICLLRDVADVKEANRLCDLRFHDLAFHS